MSLSRAEGRQVSWTTFSTCRIWARFRRSRLRIWRRRYGGVSITWFIWLYLAQALRDPHLVHLQVVTRLKGYHLTTYLGSRNESEMSKKGGRMFSTSQKRLKSHQNRPNKSKSKTAKTSGMTIQLRIWLKMVCWTILKWSLIIQMGSGAEMCRKL